MTFVGAAPIGSGGAYLTLENQTQARVFEAQTEVTSVKDDLLGYTKYTDYISASMQVVTAQAKFVAAKVARQFALVEHLETGRFGLKPNAQ